MDEVRRLAFRHGLTPDEFWGLTPHETYLYCRARNQSEMGQFRHDLFTAWHTAAFERQKRLPNLRSLMSRLEGRRQGQTWQETLALARAMNAAMGGKDTSRTRH